MQRVGLLVRILPDLWVILVSPQQVETIYRIHHQTKGPMTYRFRNQLDSQGIE